jgi:hypothetical protein
MMLSSGTKKVKLNAPYNMYKRPWKEALKITQVSYSKSTPMLRDSTWTSISSSSIKKIIAIYDLGDIPEKRDNSVTCNLLLLIQTIPNLQ